MNDNNLIFCKCLGYNRPTEVWHNGEYLKTEKMTICDLVKAWREKWAELKGEWIVLSLNNRCYKAAQERIPYENFKTVCELLYEQKVICINAYTYTQQLGNLVMGNILRLIENDFIE